MVLPGRREAAVAALLVAEELLVAEVPTARALIQVAANSPLMADLRRSHLAGGQRDGWIKACPAAPCSTRSTIFTAAPMRRPPSGVAVIVVSRAFLTLTSWSGSSR